MSEPLETAYLTFGLQVAGVLIAVFVAIRLGRPYGAVRTAAAVAVVAILLAPLVPRVRSGGQAFSDVRETLRVPPEFSPSEKCFLDGGDLRGAFVTRWLRERIPPHDRWAIEPVKGIDRACYQLNMGSRVLTDASQNPGWTLKLGRRDPELRNLIRAERGLPAAERTVQVFDAEVALVENR